MEEAAVKKKKTKDQGDLGVVDLSGISLVWRHPGRPRETPRMLRLALVIDLRRGHRTPVFRQQVMVGVSDRVDVCLTCDGRGHLCRAVPRARTHYPLSHTASLSSPRIAPLTSQFVFVALVLHVCVGLRVCLPFPPAIRSAPATSSVRAGSTGWPLHGPWRVRLVVSALARPPHSSYLALIGVVALQLQPRPRRH